MSEFYKVIVLAVVSSIFVIILKQTKPEIASLLYVVIGIILLGVIISKLQLVFSFINRLVEASNIDKNILSIILKTVLIACLADFAINLCNDMGSSSIGSKIAVFSKILILIESLPLIESLFQVVLELV
jgi:stage III sporulation protein AD